MIIFDQLRISDKGDKMYINLHVNTAADYDDIYLDSLTIVLSDKVSEISPYSPSDNFVYQKVFGENEKSANLVLLPTDFNEQFPHNNFSQDLFFVYVKAKGTPGPCTPCGGDNETTLGVTFDENLLYQQVMQYTKELANDCQVPVGFTDFILKWNAFKASIETGHYVPAIKYYNLLFGDGTANAYVTKGCGCHG